MYRTFFLNIHDIPYCKQFFDAAKIFDVDKFINGLMVGITICLVVSLSRLTGIIPSKFGQAGIHR